LTLILGQFSVRESLLVVSGAPETKALQTMLPDILKQVGPKQYQFLKSAFGGAAAGGKKEEEEEDDDDVPELVGNFDSVA
jgi:nascent polypeptide-associated complex subunit beta